LAEGVALSLTAPTLLAAAGELDQPIAAGDVEAIDPIAAAYA
jgi:hypothetical protein